MSSEPPALSKPEESSSTDKDSLAKKSEDFDETEKTLGISEYLTTSVGFSGVVKARFSDFLVHEVGLDGSIARLTNLEVPASSSKKQEPEPSIVETKEEAPEQKERKPYDWPALQSELDAMIKDPSIAETLMKLLQTHNRKEECEEKFVFMPPLEKAERRSIHEWVRGSLPCARSDNGDNGCIRIWHVKFENQMNNYKTFADPRKKKQKLSWPTDRPDFLQFVMYKENTDTTTATKELSRRGGKARIGYAGMKDKRGVTAQFCSLYRTEPQQIASQRRPGGGGNTKQGGASVVQAGNFQFVSEELRLGKLTGNRFDIVLRNVQMNDTDGELDMQLLRDAATSMKEKGFINYFGTQRFGKFNDTHKVGIAVLQGDYRKAADIIMDPKPGDRPYAAKGREDWKNRFENGETPENEKECAKRVMKTMNRFMTAETSLMQSLSRNPMDYKKAFGCIPKNLRTMFVHAVQSLIWNKAASHRIVSMNKDEVLVGDLIEGKGDTRVEIVTQEDIDNKKYTLEDVVVPLIGTKTKLPENKLADFMKETMESELGITMDLFKKVQGRDLAIYGDYRKLICRPKDFDFDIKEYYDPLQPLIQTDLMKLDGDNIEIQPKTEENDKIKVAMIVGFSLPSSSYATIALRELTKKPTSNEYQMELKL